MVIWSIPYCRYFFVSFVSVKALKYDYVEQCYIMFGIQYGLRGESKVGGPSVACLFRIVPFHKSRSISIRFSEAIYTEPIGLSDSGLFLNQVAVAGTNASLEEVRRAVKAMEKRLGRMSDSKQKGKIPIDIDLLLWNGTILKPADWEKEYVQLLFRSVAD